MKILEDNLEIVYNTGPFVNYVWLSPCERNTYTEAERRRNKLFYKMKGKKDIPYKIIRSFIIVIYLIVVLAAGSVIGWITGDGLILPAAIGYIGATALPLVIETLRDNICFKIPNELFIRRRTNH